MAETTKESAEVEIIGAAAETSESEIARLTAENEELKARVETLTRDRDQYRKWWTESNAEKDKLRDIIKPLITYSGLL